MEISSAGTAALQADELVLRRELGRPLVWRCLVNIDNDPETPRALAEILESGDAKGCPVWTSGAGERFPLWADMPIVAAAPQQVTEAVHKALLVCSDTSESSQGGVHPRALRWRVHTAADMLALMRRLNHVAVIPDSVGVQLQNQAFPDGPNARIVQDGLSDWEFAQWVLGQYRWQARAHVGASIVLSGGASSNEGTAGRWYAAFGDYESHVKLNNIGPRTIKLPAPGFRQLRFGRFESPGTLPDRTGHDQSCVSVSRLYRRHSGARPADEWERWRTRDLPQFLEDPQAMVLGLEDRFVPDGEMLLWETTIHTVPVGGRCPAAVMSAPRPWQRIGQVVETTKRGPWVKVKLPGFEEGHDVVLARLVSPYSGVDGVTGVHLTPERDSSVLVSWSGRLGESVTAVGNVRTAEAKEDAPMLQLDLDVRARLSKIKVESVGAIDVGSELSVTAEKAAAVRSNAALSLHGDGGAAAKLSGGVVNVGSGE